MSDLFTTLHDTPPLDVWVSKQMLLGEGIRPCPLLMHLSPADTSTQTLFWNPLRAVLPGLVRVHYFEEMAQAGPLVLVPHDVKEWRPGLMHHRLKRHIAEAIRSGRTVVSFAIGVEYSPQPGEITFMSAVYRWPGEVGVPLPCWLYDLGSQVSPLSRPAIPTISFVGNTEYRGRISRWLNALPLPTRFMNRVACSRTAGRTTSLNVRFGLARWLRRRVIDQVLASPALQAHIIERGNFFLFPEAEVRRARAEYIQSMRENAYILCMRGDANTDFRTYEVLSAGRIPVIVDTKMRFPALEGMRWEDFCVFVPLHQLHRIGELVARFHEGLDEEGFQARCRLARAAFEQLMPHRYIHRIVREVHQRTILSNQMIQA